jgi:hypothetical protein
MNIILYGAGLFIGGFLLHNLVNGMFTGEVCPIWSTPLNSAIIFGIFGVALAIFGDDNFKFSTSIPVKKDEIKTDEKVKNSNEKSEKNRNSNENKNRTDSGYKKKYRSNYKNRNSKDYKNKENKPTTSGNSNSSTTSNNKSVNKPVNKSEDSKYELFPGVFANEAVPEPSSAALLGLGGLALILRRKK